MHLLVLCCGAWYTCMQIGKYKDPLLTYAIRQNQPSSIIDMILEKIEELPPQDKTDIMKAKNNKVSALLCTVFMATKAGNNHNVFMSYAAIVNLAISACAGCSLIQYREQVIVLVSVSDELCQMNVRRVSPRFRWQFRRDSWKI